MNKMPGFGFYTDCFAGRLIPESDFVSAICRAREILAGFKARYRVSGDENRENMALCAMAEVVYATSQNPGIASASVGSVSVKYDKSQADLYRVASRYLDIYRGVGA